MAEKIDLTPEKDGGVLKEILRAGEGEATPAESCTVSVHYHGTLQDGTVFDSSRERNQEFEFQLGMAQVIKAWDLGVASMKLNELCRLTCAPEYAYGKTGSPPKIPADATLIFEVELLRWKYEDISPEKNGSIERKVITKGELYSTPGDLAECSVHLRATHKGHVFDERDVNFVVGEAVLQDVPRGIEIAVQKMKKGEKSDIIMRGKYLKKEKLIPADADEVTYQVTLLNFEKAKQGWEMSTEEKLTCSEKDKAKGTEHLSAGRLDQALKYYKRVREFMAAEDRLEGEDKIKRDALLLAGLLNAALVHLKQDDNLACIESCNEALEIDPKSVKAFFRRGQAQLAVNEYEQAKGDFSQCLEIDPENKAATAQLQTAKAKMKAYHEKEKRMFKSMFAKMSDSKDDQPASTEQGVWNNEEAATTTVEAQ